MRIKPSYLRAVAAVGGLLTAIRIKPAYLIATAVIWSLMIAIVLLAASKPAETVFVTRGPITQTIVARGRVMPPERAELSTQVTATVKNVLVHAGDLVKAGETLVTLSKETPGAAVVKVNPATDLETHSAQAGLTPAASASLTAAEASDPLSISAPFDGQVLSRQIEPGALTQPGKVLITLAQQGETHIYVEVDKKNLRFIQNGQKAKVTADAAPTQHFDTEVYFIGSAVDPSRGTAEVRLRLAQPVWALKTDMTVSAEMLLGKKELALQVENDAIRDADSAQPYVLAIKDGKAQPLAVKLGLRGPDTTEILEGVQNGELLIVKSAQVQAGDRVKSQPRQLKKLDLESPDNLKR